MSRAEMGWTSGRISLKPLYLDTLKKLNLHYGVFCGRNKFPTLDHIFDWDGNSNSRKIKTQSGII